MTWQILQGDNRHTLRTIADNTIDAIVTDPPYGIDFLGKAWDANTGALETYQECLRVLKPGGHILAFSAARTYHHLAVTLEQAGFEIRDQIMWIYSSGFPKSQDVGKAIDRVVDTTKNAGFGQTDHARVRAGEEWSTTAREVGVVKCTDPQAKAWSGWGTALKPAHEPICLARKPMKTSIARNCQEWGVGALNIDACRVAVEHTEIESFQKNWDRVNAGMAEYAKLDGTVASGAHQLVDQMQDISHYKPAGRFPSNVIGDIPLYQKYFYCPKVSRAERHVDGQINNNHPTVKPVALMRYLIQLITPAGGTVLDPFTGSGSTGMAAVALGHTFVGCELDANYVDIARKRIQAWVDLQRDPNFDRLFEIAE